MNAEREPLTQGRILDAAIEIIDHEGLSAVTMEKLGAALDVTGMAIYKHFSNKDALLDGVLDALLGSLAPARPQGTWQERVNALFLELWRLFREHPNALQLVGSRALSGSGTRDGIARAELVLMEAGFDEGRARLTVMKLTAYALGFASLVAGGYPAGSSARTLADPMSVRAVNWDEAERDYVAGLEALIAAS